MLKEINGSTVSQLRSGKKSKQGLATRQHQVQHGIKVVGFRSRPTDCL
jgi:hypothetical protein